MTAMLGRLERLMAQDLERRADCHAVTRQLMPIVHALLELQVR
jgi:hypothetical protein